MPNDIGVVLEPVQSSNIKSRGYNEGERVLAVEFHTGVIMHYAGVPPGTWQRWVEAPSPGSFFAHHIRGKFVGRKVTGTCPGCGHHGPLETKCYECGGRYEKEERHGDSERQSD